MLENEDSSSLDTVSEEEKHNFIIHDLKNEVNFVDKSEHNNEKIQIFKIERNQKIKTD